MEVAEWHSIQMLSIIIPVIAVKLVRTIICFYRLKPELHNLKTVFRIWITAKRYLRQNYLKVREKSGTFENSWNAGFGFPYLHNGSRILYTVQDVGARSRCLRFKELTIARSACQVKLYNRFHITGDFRWTAFLW